MRKKRKLQFKFIVFIFMDVVNEPIVYGPPVYDFRRIKVIGADESGVTIEQHCAPIFAVTTTKSLKSQTLQVG